MVARIVSLPILVVSAALVGAAPAAASCLPSTPKEQAERAEVSFDGVALEGPTASGRQRFEVRRYLKRGGPDVVQVATGVTRRADGSGGSFTSVSLDVARGDAWRINGDRISDGVVSSSSCAGSRRITGRDLPDANVGADGSDRTKIMLVAAVVAALAALGTAVALRRMRRPATR